MKQLILIISLLFSTLCVIAQQDTIANAGFESWSVNAQYDDLDHWTTLNPSGVILGAELAFQATEPGEFHSGLSAVKLVTADVQFFGIIPSILTTGEVNTTTQQVEGGWPIDSRPTTFGGWFRYDTLAADTGFVSITLTRWNSVSGMTEVIGSAEQNIVSTDSAFINIELTIDYLNSETPDTVLILAGSGGNVAQEGSALFVDDVYYTFTTGIETPESIGLNIYPNPTNDILNFSNRQGLVFTEARLFALDGREVSFHNLHGKQSISTDGLITGSYVLELIADDKTVVRKSILKK